MIKPLVKGKAREIHVHDGLVNTTLSPAEDDYSINQPSRQKKPQPVKSWTLTALHAR